MECGGLLFTQLFRRSDLERVAELDNVVGFENHGNQGPCVFVGHVELGFEILVVALFAGPNVITSKVGRGPS